MDIETIRKRIEQVEKLQEEIKISKEMLKGELENEMNYLEAAEAVKAAVLKRKVIKEEILGTGPNQEVSAGIKENSDELKTLKEILSAELQEYHEKSHTDEVVGRKFVLSAKLLPKKSGYEKRDGEGRYAGVE